MIIKRVDISDAPELLELYRPYVEKTAITFEYEVPSLDEFTERIVQIEQKYPYLLAKEDGMVLGYAYASAFKGRAMLVSHTLIRKVLCFMKRKVIKKLHILINAAIRWESGMI